MNIIIQLNNSLPNQETISNNLLEYLYNLAKNNLLGNTSYLSGNLYVPGTYLAYIDKLHGDYNDLIMTAGKIYMLFEDHEFGRIMNLYVSSDGIGCTLSDLDTITTINKDATQGSLADLLGEVFYLNTNLTSAIDLLKLRNLTSLSDNVFAGCTNITEIGIPSSVTSIGNYVLQNNTVLSKVVVPDINSYMNMLLVRIDLFKNRPARLYELLNGLEVEVTDLTVNLNFAASKLFIACKSLESVTISEGVTFIKNESFAECPNLESLSLPSTCSTIEQYAFKDCSNLELITGLNNVISIKQQAFRNCNNLYFDVNELGNITTLEGSAFHGCSKVYGELYMPHLVNISGEAHFKQTNISKIKCLAALTSVPNWFALESTSLTEVYLPYECTTISYGSFYGCSGLTSVKQYTLPIELWVEGQNPTYSALSRVTTIGNLAFRGCSNLVDIDLSGVTSILDAAFYGCSSLANVTLGNITNIPANAFHSCSSLTSITFPTTLLTIGGNAFYGTKLKRAIFPYGMTSVNLSSVATGRADNMFWLKYVQVPSTATECSMLDIFRDSPSPNTIFVILATTPPVTGYKLEYEGGWYGSGFMWGSPGYGKWYVPDAVVNDYKVADGWHKFPDKIYPISQLETDSPTYWAVYQANKDYGVPAQS